MLIFAEFNADWSAHQAAHERVHPLVANRTAQDLGTSGHRRTSNHPQRRNLQDARQAVEGGAQRQGPRTLHPRGRTTEASSHERISGLQVPASKPQA